MIRRASTNSEDSHQEYAIEIEGDTEFAYIPVDYEMGRQLIRKTGIGRLVSRTITTITEPWWPLGPDPSEYVDPTKKRKSQ